MDGNVGINAVPCQQMSQGSNFFDRAVVHGDLN